MTIRHGYLYDFKRACHVEGRIKISFLSNSQVIFQDEKKKRKRKKLAQANWKLTLEKPLWAFRGGIWNSSGHKFMSMKCVESQIGKHSHAGKARIYSPVGLSRAGHSI